MRIQPNDAYDWGQLECWQFGDTPRDLKCLRLVDECVRYGILYHDDLAEIAKNGSTSKERADTIINRAIGYYQRFGFELLFSSGRVTLPYANLLKLKAQKTAYFKLKHAVFYKHALHLTNKQIHDLMIAYKRRVPVPNLASQFGLSPAITRQIITAYNAHYDEQTLERITYQGRETVPVCRPPHSPVIDLSSSDYRVLQRRKRVPQNKDELRALAKQVVEAYGHKITRCPPGAAQGAYPMRLVGSNVG